MTDTKAFNRDNESLNEHILDHFPEDDRELVKNIWNKSRQADPVTGEEAIGPEETEKALTAVHRRIGVEKESSSSAEKKSNIYSLDWKWLMAAASILVIIGAGFLFVPKTIEVPYGETASVELPDGSVVELNSGSELQYSRLFSLRHREVSLNGEAFFDVQKGALPFKVQANSSVVQVTGTQFNVRSWQLDPGSETEVTVTEGSVRFFPESNEEQSVSISPGEISRWAEGLLAPTSPDSAALERVLAWRSRSFVFSKKPLEVILREMERRFNINITLEAESYSSERVTIHYVNPEDVEVILKDICRVKGLRYSASTDGFRIYE
ncbi:MAG: FecR domain-containing protein [Balneolaceae bacterium]|nr:FecR domain-containing protein [Balneolaceae bacterium]